MARARARANPVVLYDATERPFNASATVAAWRGSNSESRRSRSWMVSDSGPNALFAGDVAEVRRKSHDLTRKSPWAESALDSFVANCIGNGIVPRPLTDDDDLRRELMEAWQDFIEECDADGNLDFYGQQALVCRSQGEGGDCFVRLRPRRERDGLCVPLQLQVLEAELVDPAFEELRPNGKIQAGIEFDAIGQRIAYHMFREHPNEMRTTRSAERVRVPAENVLHVFEVLRAGQIRGIPRMASTIAKLWELDKYDDAELMRKQVAAMFAGFVLNPSELSNPLDAGGVEGEDDDGRPLATLEPGTMQELEPGQDVKFAAPADVGQSYEVFVRSQLRQIAAGAKVTYEQLTGDLTGVNFTSIRAGMIEFHRRMQQKQRNVIIYKLCRPVWRRFVEAAVLCGRIAIPTDPRKLRDLTRVAWTPTPGKEYVDPEKEVRAVILKLRAGLISRSKAVAEHGFDAEALDREIEADNRRADAMGLRFDGDGRVPANGGGGGAPPFNTPGGGPGDEGEGARDVFREGEEEDAEDEAARAMLRGLRRIAARGELQRGIR